MLMPTSNTWVIDNDTQQATSGDMDIVDVLLLFIAFMTYPPISFPLVALIYTLRWSPVVEPIITGTMFVVSGEVDPKEILLTALPHVAEGQKLLTAKKTARLVAEKAEDDEVKRLKLLSVQKEQHLDYLRQERQAITESQTVVEFLYNSLRTFLTGTTGSGKSVVMWNLCKALSEQGFEAYVADLKSDRDGKKWPFAHKVAGYGYGTNPEAFDEIEALFKQWLTLMSYRAEQQSTFGQDTFPPAVLIIDEANMIGAGLLSTESCKTAFISAIETTLRLGRELNMGLFMAAQDDQVENLGIEGKSAMLRNFNYRVEVVKVRNIRKAVVLDGQKRPVATFNVPELFDPITLLKKPSQKPSLNPSTPSVVTGTGSEAAVQTPLPLPMPVDEDADGATMEDKIRERFEQHDDLRQAGVTSNEGMITWLRDQGFSKRAQDFREIINQVREEVLNKREETI